MNLEDLNNEYLRLKNATTKYKTNLEKEEKDLEVAEKNKETAENNLKTAKTNSEKKRYQTDLNNAITELNDIKFRIEMVKNLLERNKEDIDNVIEYVKAMPEVKEQCSRAIDIKTERQIKKFETQKKEQEEKKANLEQLKNMIGKHPQATVIVNTIENKSFEINKKESEIKDIDAKLSKLDPADSNYATDKAKLDSDKAKLEGEHKTLVGERQVERNNLKKLFNNPKYNEAIDNLTTRSALDKSINNCERLVRRSENKIHDYTYAKDSLYNTNNINNINNTNLTQTQSKWEAFKSLFTKRGAGDPSRWETFKSLFKKQPALPVPTTTTTTTVQKSFKDEIKLDDNIMKNEVVQEIYNETFKSKVEEGKNER